MRFYGKQIFLSSWNLVAHKKAGHLDNAEVLNNNKYTKNIKKISGLG